MTSLFSPSEEENILSDALKLSFPSIIHSADFNKSAIKMSKESGYDAEDLAAAEQELAIQEAAEQAEPSQHDIHMRSVDSSEQDWDEEMVPLPVDEALLQNLMDMGFSDIRARKGIFHGKSLDGALGWITEHQEDADIDQPYMVRKADTIPKPPLTAEERQRKLDDMKAKIAKRREDIAKQEKAEEIRREKERRERGQKMDETLEERQRMQRKRDADRIKKEKEDEAKERQRLKAEIARDKEIRRLNKGVLPSVLGVEGYNPSIIQYDTPAAVGTNSSVPSSSESNIPPTAPSTAATAKVSAAAVEQTKPAPIKKANSVTQSTSSQPPPERIDQAIATISRYRTAGDGGQALKLLVTFVKNIVSNPDEPKYRSINTESAAFKSKLATLVGPLSLLKALGFEKDESDGKLKYEGAADAPLLVETLQKLVQAEATYQQMNP